MDKESMEMFQKILGRLDTIDGRLVKMDERLGKMDERLDILEMKQDLTAKKLDDLQLDVKIFERDTKRNFHKLNDEMDTVIEILKVNGLIPH